MPCYLIKYDVQFLIYCRIEKINGIFVYIYGKWVIKYKDEITKYKDQITKYKAKPACGHIWLIDLSWFCCESSVLRVIECYFWIRVSSKMNYRPSYTLRWYPDRNSRRCTPAFSTVIKHIWTNYLLFKRCTASDTLCRGFKHFGLTPWLLMAQVLQFPFLSSTHIQDNIEIFRRDHLQV